MYGPEALLRSIEYLLHFDRKSVVELLGMGTDVSLANTGSTVGSCCLAHQRDRGLCRTKLFTSKSEIAHCQCRA